MLSVVCGGFVPFLSPQPNVKDQQKKCGWTVEVLFVFPHFECKPVTHKPQRVLSYLATTKI